MDLHLTADQAGLLLAELNRIIDGARYPLSRRIRSLLKPYTGTPAASAAAEATRAAEQGALCQASLMKPYRGPMHRPEQPHARDSPR